MFTRRKHGGFRLWTSVALLILLALVLAEPQLLLDSVVNMTEDTAPNGTTIPGNLTNATENFLEIPKNTSDIVENDSDQSENTVGLPAENPSVSNETFGNRTEAPGNTSNQTLSDVTYPQNQTVSVLTTSDVSAFDDDVLYLMVGQRNIQGHGWLQEAPWDEGPTHHYAIYDLYSLDGQNFTFINPEQMISQNDTPLAMTRDGAIFYKDGYFYIMWPHTPRNESDNHFDLYYSDNLINWTEHEPFAIPGCRAVAGGNWYIDNDGTPYALMPMTTTGNIGLNSVYISHPLTDDPKGEWSAPDYFSGGPWDPTVIKLNNTYFLVIAGGGGRVYSSPSLGEPWTAYSTALYSGKLGGAEGFSAIDLGNGTWRMYSDDGDPADYYVDVTWNGTALVFGLKTNLTMDVVINGPNVIKLTDPTAIQIVRDAIGYYSGTSVRNLTYTSTDPEEYVDGDGNLYALDKNHNRPIRTYNLADPGTDKAWKMYLDNPVDQVDDALESPTSGTAEMEWDPSYPFQAIDSNTFYFRVYAYETSGSLTKYSSTYLELTVAGDDASFDMYRLNLSWDPVDGATGYLIMDNVYTLYYNFSSEEITEHSYYDYFTTTSLSVIYDATGTTNGTPIIRHQNHFFINPTNWTWKFTFNMPATSHDVNLSIYNRFLIGDSLLTTISASTTPRTYYMEIRWNGTAYVLDTSPEISWNWTDINSTISANYTTICVNAYEIVNCTLHFDGVDYPNGTNDTNICWEMADLAEGNYTVNATCWNIFNSTANTSNAWLDVAVPEEESEESHHHHDSCEEPWSCSDWSACTNSKQTRTCDCSCDHDADCTGDHDEERSCTSGPSRTPPVTNQVSNQTGGNETEPPSPNMTVETTAPTVGSIVNITVSGNGSAVLTGPNGSRIIQVTDGMISFVPDQPGTWTVTYTDQNGDTSSISVLVGEATFNASTWTATEPASTLLLPKDTPTYDWMLYTIVGAIILSIVLLLSHRKKRA